MVRPMRLLLDGSRAVINALLLIAALCFWGTAFIAVMLFRIAALPFPRLRPPFVQAMAEVADGFALTCRTIFFLTLPTIWEIRGTDRIRRDGLYLLMSNHRAWTDIFALFVAVGGKVPFFRFFIKQGLIWFPIIGLAAWGLEFPFMKRYSREYLAKNPHRRGTDLATTRRACERYRDVPVTMVNFVEGTRFNRRKQRIQGSPFENLLRPRIGGISFVLASLGASLHGIYDVTIAYPGTDGGVFSFIAGRVPRVVVELRQLDVPPRFFDAGVTEPGSLRDELRDWLHELWQEKDARISSW
jgi:1-acyl-sn-glycerol-3-phosphate acyltransferase